jgi:hypothetical protein
MGPEIIKCSSVVGDCRQFRFAPPTAYENRQDSREAGQWLRKLIEQRGCLLQLAFAPFDMALELGQAVV